MKNKIYNEVDEVVGKYDERQFIKDLTFMLEKHDCEDFSIEKFKQGVRVCLRLYINHEFAEDKNRKIIDAIPDYLLREDIEDFENQAELGGLNQVFSCFPLLNSFEEELDEYEITTIECRKEILRGKLKVSYYRLRNLKQQKKEEE